MSCLPRIASLVLVLSLLSACSAPRIDTTSDESLKSSIERVRASLSTDDRSKFDGVISEAMMGNALAAVMSRNVLPIGSALQPFNGLTGKEAIAKAEALRIEREKTERAAKATELATLESRQHAAELELQKLGAIAVTSPHVEKSGQAFLVSYDLRASVKNGLQTPLASIHFQYGLTSPNRSVPWTEGEGYFFIDGGLEPGEAREIKASAAGASLVGMYGFITLNKAMAEHPDAILTIKVTDANGPDKKSILVSTGLRESEVARLETLRKELSGQNATTTH